MGSISRTTVVVILVAIVAAAVGGWLWLSSARKAAPEAVAGAEPTPPPAPTPTFEERLSERLAGITLATSDAAVRQLVAELSARPELAASLANEDLVRRFVAAVDNIAGGFSPRNQLEFLRPADPFSVVERDDEVTIAAASYDRYDLVTAVFASLDTAGTATLYRELEPLVDEAYAEISPPGSRFGDRLDAAFDQLLDVSPPVFEPQLERKVLTWVYVDESLEGLTGAQRQLLRLGPDNMAVVQAKLRELKTALAR
jgi:phage FluMu protein gp41